MRAQAYLENVRRLSKGAIAPFSAQLTNALCEEGGGREDNAPLTADTNESRWMGADAAVMAQFTALWGTYGASPPSHLESSSRLTPSTGVYLGSWYHDFRSLV